MSTLDEKTGPAPASAPAPESRHDASIDSPADPLVIDRPAGWMYKGFRIFGKEYWYASPKIQLLVVSFVCFLCPGMFNALSGLGGGGQVNPYAVNIANTSLYSIFAATAFFSGTIANVLGLRITLSVGGLGYAVYAASFLSYNHNENMGFIIFAGAFLGFCAGLLWTAQGAIMVSYPPEKSKGRYISIFWIIFNMGAVIGSLIPLGQNIHKLAGPVTDGTYAAFIVMMSVGLVLGLFICDADKVIREDGTKVIVMKNPTWKTEFIGLYETLKNSWWIIFLFPAFFSSNIFYTYQGNGFNGSHFNTRTRALNNVLYWTAQILGAIITGFGLDHMKARRSMKAKISYACLIVLTFVVWGGGWAWQKQQVPRSRTLEDDWDALKVDWTDDGYVGPLFLYFFYGFFDAVFQTCMYWYMGALSNSSRRSTFYVGFYKGLQSAGAAIYWRLDSFETEFDIMFGSTWGLLGCSLLIGAPIIWFKIRDHIPMEEDLKFSDETVEDVVVGRDIKKGEEAA